MATSSGTTTPMPAGRAAPSIRHVDALGERRAPRIGDLVLVLVHPGVLRPMTAVEVTDDPDEGVLLCGVIHGSPDDYVFDAYRGKAPKHSELYITPRQLTGYGHQLSRGSGIGQWRFR